MPADYHQAQDWVHQADAIYAAVTAQNVWGTVLDYTGRYTHLYDIEFDVEVANETIELEVTLDGVVMVRPQAAIVGTPYQAIISGYLNSGGIAIGGWLSYQTLRVSGHNARVRIRKTTAAGAANIRCKVVHAFG